MPINNNMETSYTDVVVEGGKRTYKRHKGKVITGSSLSSVIAVLYFLGINPVDFALETSDGYKDLVGRVEAAERFTIHSDHIISNQNKLLRVAFERGDFTTEELFDMIHSTPHIDSDGPP